MRVAAIITNYNMPERADALAAYIDKYCPADVYLIDNGSDRADLARRTTLALFPNRQTTGGWLAGLEEADRSGIDYFAYWIFITSTEFIGGGDILTPMVDFLEQTSDAVGCHPALTDDSTTVWKHMIANGHVGGLRRTWMIDNIAALWRADWFDSIGRFDDKLYMAHGVDLETCWKARKANKSIWIDERTRVRKISNIGYDMGRMGMSAGDRVSMAKANMDDVLGKRYGPHYWQRLQYEYRQ